MDADKACTAAFGYPVGGIVVPVNKLGLLTHARQVKGNIVLAGAARP